MCFGIFIQLEASRNWGYLFGGLYWVKVYYFIINKKFIIKYIAKGEHLFNYLRKNIV